MCQIQSRRNAYAKAGEWTMSKAPKVAYDRLGQEMKVGTIIAAPYTRSCIVIGRITHLTAKTVRFEDIDRRVLTARNCRPTYNKYHTEVISLEKLGEEVVMLMLKQNLNQE
jgi:hypothetical protein